MPSLWSYPKPLEWLRRKRNGKTSASPAVSSINQPQEHDPGEPGSRPPTPKSDLVVSASRVPPTLPAVIPIPVLATEYIATLATILPVPNIDALVPQVPAAPTPNSKNSAPILVGGSLAPPAPPVPASTTPVQGLAPTHTVSTVKTATPSALLGPSQRPEGSYGLKVLVEGINPVVDLVAVHGLDGDRERTWTAGNGVLWLRDCGIAFLRRFPTETNTQERPIIFIAHSVGGIIVKDALIHSNSANKTNLEYHNAIKTSTCGVMFFGTPHQGTDNISWPKILFNTTSPLTRKNKAILKELEENSASLQKQLAQYNHISSDFETKFFYETYAPPGGHLIVPQGAAVVPGATNAETFAINSDHEGLVKYEGMSDTGFRKVYQCISFMVEEAPAKASENWQRRRLATAAEKNEGVQTTFKIPFELEYLRNHRFTGRELLLGETHSAVKANDASGQPTPIILHGAGGIGKSQIVVEYLYAHQEERSSIFWINSATRDTAILSFRAAAQRLIKEHAKISLKSQPHYPTIAKKLGLIGVVDENGLLFPGAEHDECIINGMKLWFSDQENRNWLLVFDNVDDLETLKIETFMPSPAAGTIIMTSRRLDCAHFGLGLEVKEMLEQEGVNLLLKTAGLHIKADNLEKNHIALVVTEKLGCLPLALVQAGAFVAARRISLENFLEIYEESFNRAFAKKPPSGVWTYKDRSILTTWEISFQAIKELSENAAELLSLCAFLSNEIRRDMLYRGEMVGIGDFTLDESLDLLYLYSLAHPQNTDGSFYIHPVVHRWAQERLEPSKRIQKAEEAIILVGRAAQHSGEKTTEDWEYERGIIPHIDSITRNAQTYLHEMVPRSGPVFMAIRALSIANSDWGRIDKAHWMGSYANKMVKEILGEHHEVTKMTMNNLASMSLEQGRWDEAERLGLDVLEARKRSLGHEHPDTLSSMSNLANAFAKQGRWDEAERLDLDVLEGRKRSLGHKHPDTLLLMGNPATAYAKQDRWDEAERWYLDLVEVRKRNFGLKHPATLISISELASAQVRQGKLTEPQKLLLEAVDAGERILGKGHPKIVNLRKTLSTISQSRNLLGGPNAEAGFKKFMAMRKGDPNLLIEMAKAAEMHMERDQAQEAEALLELIIKGREKTLGSEHPDTLSAIADLASIYRTQKRWDEAEDLQQQVIDTRQRILGNEHPDTLSAMMDLAATYWNQEWWEKAEELEEQVVDVRQKVLGSEHPDTLSAIASLAVSYRMQGLYVKAGELHQQVMETTEKLRGNEHPDTMIAMANLASAYGSQERWEEAEELQKLVMDTRQKQLGENHPVTQRAIASLADIYRNCGQHEKARDLALRSAEIDQAIPNYDHPSTQEEMVDLIKSYLAQGRVEDLQQLLFETVERRGDRDNVTVLLKMNISKIHKQFGRYDEASILRGQVIETLQSMGVGPESLVRIAGAF